MSLNDQLLQGPDLINSLVSILTHLRKEPVAPSGDLTAQLVEYWVTVHPFGVVSSPNSSNYTLRQRANNNEEEYGSAVASTLHKNFNVDDCLCSVNTEVKAKEQIEGLRQLCAKGAFCLTKYICNWKSVLDSIPEEECSKDVKTLDLNYNDFPTECALGVQWCVKSDTFRFPSQARRGILSMASYIHDPLRFATPFTLKAKKLLQDLCKDETSGWDDELPESYRNRWENWRSKLPMLKHILVPRCVNPIEFGEVKSRQVHIISDESSVGYGSVAYLHLRDNKDRTLLLPDWKSSPRPNQSSDNSMPRTDSCYRLCSPWRDPQEGTRRNPWHHPPSHWLSHRAALYQQWSETT